MKCLVTGAAGFIGSTLVDKLLANGFDVIGVDNFSTGQKNFISNALQNPNFSFHKIDLLHENCLSDYFFGVDIVFHLAANADIRNGLLNPSKDLEQNTIVTFKVLEAMRSSGVRRIVFSSTAAVLGEPKLFPTPENCPLPVQTSLYGASKIACEGLISSYCLGHNFEGYAFRFVSVLGPKYPHGHVFDFVKQLSSNPAELTILGNGTQMKSYLNVDDCTDALMHIGIVKRPAQNLDFPYQVFHLGVEDYCHVSQSAEWIVDELKLRPSFLFTGGERGWVGDNPFVFLDVKKALSTGWSPKYGIEESIRQTVRWLVANKWIFHSR